MSTENLSACMMLLGLAIMAAVMVRRVFARRVKKKRRRKSSAAPAPVVKEAQIAAAPAEVLRWQVEIHEIGRATKGEIDTKLQTLASLSLIAQHRTEQLQQALDRSDEVFGAAWRFKAPRQHTQQNLSSPLSEQDINEAYRLADLGKSTQSIANDLGYTLGEVEFAMSLRTQEV